MQIEAIAQGFAICKVASAASVDLSRPYCFVGVTGEEVSLVCGEGEVPADALACERGWRAFRIQGVLDFSLVGVLSKILALLAGGGIGIFAVSTFNTDYVFTRAADFERALAILAGNGYTICRQPPL